MKKIFFVLLTLVGLVSLISCEKKIDYAELGFESYLEKTPADSPFFTNRDNSSITLSPVSSNDGLSWWNRTPIEDDSISNNYLIFDESKINISLYGDSLNETAYYFDWMIDNGTPELTFGKITDEIALLSSFHQPNVDIFESNGVYSYALRNVYVGSTNSVIQKRYYDLFWRLKNYKDLPYSVYFNNDIIFLVSKNSKFDRKALNLDKSEGIYLFRK